MLAIVLWSSLLRTYRNKDANRLQIDFPTVKPSGCLDFIIGWMNNNKSHTQGCNLHRRKSGELQAYVQLRQHYGNINVAMLPIFSYDDVFGINIILYLECDLVIAEPRIE